MSELGVVDPIRIPPGLRRAWDRTLSRFWRPLPPLAKAFVGLSVLDVAWRAVGFAGTSLFIFLEAPISLITAFLPHNVLIALPALILARRPDAAQATPLVLRGAILLALVELLAQPLGNSAYGPGPSSFFTGLSVAIVAIFLKSVGWLALAFGLSAITAARPGPSIAGLANLVFFALAMSALLRLLQVVTSPPSLGDPVWDAMQGLAGAMYSVEALVFAYLARIVVRGSSDDRRPALATALASTSMVLMAAVAAVGLIVGVIALVMFAFAQPSPYSQSAFAFGWVGDGLPLTLLLVAFGLGLADTSVSIPGPGPIGGAGPERLDERPSWPAPGGDVPVYHQPAPTPYRGRSKRRT